jgi:uncharacterized protein (TIGR03643 family)
MSALFKQKISSLTGEDKKKLIKLAIEDKVSYKEILKLYALTPNEVEKFMRIHLDERRYKRWRIRQTKRSTAKGRPIE